jgi:hypothetical protein
MRSSISLAALAVALAWAAPSGAQMMCSPAQTGSTTSAQSSGGMMCGMMRPTQAQVPATGQQSQPQQRQGMCACCQQMAMMRPQQSMPGMGGMGGMDHMMTPQQPAPQQSAPGTPETPKQP